MTKFLVFVAGAGVAALAAACGPVVDTAAPHVGKPPFEVVATTGMVADAVENVGGDRVRVEALMGPGIDPHLYRASEGDVTLLANADLIVFNGLHLEAKLSDVLERIEDRTAAVTTDIPRSRLIRFKGTYDPHLWFDVRLWMSAVERVETALTDLDPAGRAVYRARARRYLDELRALDAYARRELRRVPPERRVLVTAHDAFNYFGRAYGYDVVGLQGISTVAEAGAADVQALAQLIAERRIPTVFVETSVSPRAIEAVREAVASRGFNVRIGRGLYSDAMGDEGTPEGTYVGMVRHNVDTIVAGLLTEGE